MSESDGIEEALGQSLREAMQVAEQVGRQWSKVIGQLRERARRRREAEEQRVEAQVRYQHAWEKAQEKLSVVDDTKWWNEATPQQVAEVYEIAASWREHEVEAARVDDVIHREVLDHYGHDLRNPSPQQVQDDLERIESQRAEGQGQVQDNTAEHESGEVEFEPKATVWGSKEHLSEFEKNGHEMNIEVEVIEARKVTFKMYGSHPREAVQSQRPTPQLSGRRDRPLALGAGNGMDR